MSATRYRARDLALTLLTTLGAAAIPAQAQLFDIPPLTSDSVHPPFVPRATPVLPGAILPHYRIVAYYGNPRSTRMGILGELPPEEMLRRLDAVAAEWQQADSTRGVKPALHLIVTVAQGQPGSDGKYRLRHGDDQIAMVSGWAEARGWLLFLDVQVGHSTVTAELPRLIPWLRKPWIHLGLDPEFAMPLDQIPGRKIGTLDARDVNHAVDLLARLVSEEQLPPKILVVHRFTIDMLTNHRSIRQDPRVQVVINGDGFGSPAGKRRMYEIVVSQRPVQFAGLKLFYKNDRPMLAIRDILALRPIPLYIQYQ